GARERGGEQRQELAARAREKLANEPAKLQRFDTLMESAKHNLSVTEDHSYWIDQMSTAAFRRFCLQVATGLVRRGALGRADGVFYLYKDELRQALSGTGEWRGVIRERREAMAESARIVPPD